MTSIPLRWQGGATRARLAGIALIAVLLAPGGAFAQKPAKKAKRKPNPAFAVIKDNPALPRVLLIGDSISIGYTVAVRKLLAGKANLHRIPTNGGPTTRGLAQIDRWLGKGRWDVIHFNWGLHDLKYMGPNGQNLADPGAETSHQQVPIEAYARNLRALVKRLKKTGAALIWCTTTPVPRGARGRVVGDSKRYNDVAAKVMKKEGIASDDLYSAALPLLKKIQQPANVHFTPKGSAYLAKKVAASILSRLPKAKRPPGKKLIEILD